VLAFKYCIILGPDPKILYIIFRNVEIFRKKKIRNIFLKEKKESDRIFENISYIKMESSKLIDYLTNMCRTEQGTMVVSYLYYPFFHVHGWQWGKT
jgi:hypothetical protein